MKASAPSPDYFALLKQPRRPWLDLDTLKSQFLDLSSQWHPDRVHNEDPETRAQAQGRYTELNAAYHCLRETKDRLLHLLQLETGSQPKPVQAVPPSVERWFMGVAKLTRETDQFLSRSQAATSPMLKAEFFAQAVEWSERVSQLRQELFARSQELDGELASLNAAFESAPPAAAPERRAGLPLARLEQIYCELSYLNRWARQLQERLLQLSL